MKGTDRPKMKLMLNNRKMSHTFEVNGVQFNLDLNVLQNIFICVLRKNESLPILDILLTYLLNIDYNILLNLLGPEVILREH